MREFDVFIEGAHADAADHRGSTVEHVRTAWVIEVGGLRVSRARSMQRVVERVLVEPAQRRQSKFNLKRAGIATAAMVAAATPIYLTQANGLIRAPYVVGQVVPELNRPALEIPSLPKHSHHPRPTAAAGFVTVAVAEELGIPLSGDQAIALAWRTGEPQDWAEKEAHGIVVPGPAEETSGLVCRSLARLTRQAGQPDDVEQFRRCSTSVAPPAANPQ